MLLLECSIEAAASRRHPRCNDRKRDADAIWRARQSLEGVIDDRSGERLFVPDPMMPGGMIWPPVDGRCLVSRLTSRAEFAAREAPARWLAEIVPST